MKLVMAIMSKDDSSVVMEALTEESFQVTRMASTGGFLKSGNTTLIIGVEDNNVGSLAHHFSLSAFLGKQSDPSGWFPWADRRWVSSQSPFDFISCLAV